MSSNAWICQAACAVEQLMNKDTLLTVMTGITTGHLKKKAAWAISRLSLIRGLPGHNIADLY
jgi:hypothetical protein